MNEQINELYPLELYFRHSGTESKSREKGRSEREHYSTSRSGKKSAVRAELSLQVLFSSTEWFNTFVQFLISRGYSSKEGLSRSPTSPN